MKILESLDLAERAAFHNLLKFNQADQTISMATQAMQNDQGIRVQLVY